MAKVAVVAPDGRELHRLINVWDHGCETPGECTHRRSAVPRFARTLRNPRRHDQTIWNIISGNKAVVSVRFARQIARALGVDEDRITRPDAEAQAALDELGPAGLAPGQRDYR